ncbi:MAG: response regulator [Lachnospiraceae bacterium]|nr:response regulator [Lachnospiraceae bacterium]
MDNKLEKTELFEASHLTLLLTYTVFSVILIGESILMSWEDWAVFLIIVAVLFSWTLHIQNRLPEDIRLWVYSILMMCTFFFYGIHETSTFDLAAVMSAVIILYTMTGIKSLITLCQVTYYLTFTYDILLMVKNNADFDSLMVSRIMLHFAMIFATGALARFIIDRWVKVLDRSGEEIEQLTKATDRLNDFLANVSHEIRTPINAIIGLSGICADKTEDEDMKKELLAINSAGHRAAEQISDILDFTEIDRKSIAKNEEDYMLSSILNDLVNKIRPEKPENLELVIDVDPAIPAVMKTDISKLSKILFHLISNGLKYTREGGVYVRIYSMKKDYGVNLCIEVTDTGIGMTAEELENLSERFYQVDSGRSRKSSGLGLGLAIVNGFVSSLGGFMRINSRYGSGTTVNVSLPQEVIDETSCMSVADREKLSLGAFLHFEKFEKPEVRDYYNSMVRNIVRGLGVQMHRVDNVVNLKKLHQTVRLTHLFVGQEEYETDTALMEKLAREMKVVVVADSDFVLPKSSAARIMEKPFYCFPVAAVLNEGTDMERVDHSRIRCKDVHVLVVDDEPMNLIVAKRIFGKYGIRVSTAASGQESIDKCRTEEYDAVFMDHMMPGMDGVTAMKKIRMDAQKARTDLPIVALTANAVSTAREMFLKEGFDGFVSKPIEFVELERVLKKVLPKNKVSYENDEEIQAENIMEGSVKEEEKKPADPYEVLGEYGVDTATGLDYCMNDDDFFKTLLLQFEKEEKEKRPEMDRLFKEQDMENYAILVHALKSTAKMIGCTALSEAAKGLEGAAKTGDTEYVEGNHEQTMKDYGKVASGIRLAFDTESETV